MNFSEKYKPAVTKRTLLFIAGCFWLIGGGMLMTKALIALINIDHMLSFELISGVVFGICFYVFLFTEISKKHITRISLIKADFPCFFSFFNFRSYILMAIMITTGIILRKTNIIEAEYLYTSYLAMSVPLILSAFRFFIAAFKNKIQV
ncbi:MAG: hypothetical protein V1904_04125 [Bacteroidota bacterium]